MRILKSSVGLVVLTVLFVLLSATPSFFAAGDYELWRQDWRSALPIAFSALVAMLVLPALTIRKLFREDPQDYGLRLPENIKKSFVLTLAAVFILLPAVAFFATQDSFREYYPVAGLSFLQFLYSAVLASSVYYLAEEFLFRGFLFWGLWRKIGYHSFWVTALLFTFFHLTKPIPEVMFAFFASLIFSYLSLKTKSFLPAAAVHFLIALILNILLVFLSVDSGAPGAFRF